MSDASSLRASAANALRIMRMWDAANERLLAAAAAHCNALTAVGHEEVVESREAVGALADACCRAAELQAASSLDSLREAEEVLADMGELLVELSREAEAVASLVDGRAVAGAPMPQVDGVRGDRVEAVLGACANAAAKELLTKHLSLSGLADGDERARTLALAAMQTEPWRSADPDAHMAALEQLCGDRKRG